MIQSNNALECRHVERQLVDKAVEANVTHSVADRAELPVQHGQHLGLVLVEDQVVNAAYQA